MGSLCCLTFMALNTLVLSLTHLVPWAVKTSKNARVGEKIYKADVNYFVAFLRATENGTKKQCKGHLRKIEINHPKGHIYVTIPNMGYSFNYKNIFQIQPLIDDFGLYLHVTWKKENHEAAASFLEWIVMRIDPTYKN